MLANRIILALGTSGVIAGAVLYWWSDKIVGIAPLVSAFVLCLVWGAKRLNKKISLRTPN